MKHIKIIKILALNPHCIETINNLGFIFQKINNLNEAKNYI